MCVLLIDPQTDLANRLSVLLGPHGLSVVATSSREEADEVLRTQDVTMILLGSVLHDGSGMQYLKVLRSYPATRELPLIMLGAHATEFDVAIGLEAGADDYVSKPVSAVELQRRILAVRRRCEAPRSGADDLGGERRCGPITFEEATRRVRVDGATIALRPAEIDLLAHLIGAPGRIFTRTQLVRLVCGSEEVHERVIDVHIRRLRVSLSRFGAGELIETVRGIGYRLVERPTLAHAAGEPGA